MAPERPEDVVWNNWHRSNALTQAGCWLLQLRQKAEAGLQPLHHMSQTRILLEGISSWGFYFGNETLSRESQGVKQRVQEQPLSDAHKEVCVVLLKEIPTEEKPKCHVLFQVPC